MPLPDMTLSDALARTSAAHGDPALLPMLVAISAPALNAEAILDLALQHAQDDCTLLGIGHQLWYIFNDLEEQTTPEYEEARFLRAEAGYRSPPSMKIDDVFSTVANYLRNPDHGRWYANKLITDKFFPSRLEILGQKIMAGHNTITGLCLEIRSVAWWIDGYKKAIERFGAETTLAALAAMKPA